MPSASTFRTFKPVILVPYFPASAIWTSETCYNFFVWEVKVFNAFL